MKLRTPWKNNGGEAQCTRLVTDSTSFWNSPRNTDHDLDARGFECFKCLKRSSFFAEELIAKDDAHHSLTRGMGHVVKIP